MLSITIGFASLLSARKRSLSERPSSVTIYSLISLMTTLWSLNYIIAKYALREFPPLLTSGLRMLLAGSIMIAVYRWQRAKATD